MQALSNLHLTFIGGGNMAQAIMLGLTAAGVPASHMTVVDPAAACRQHHQDAGRCVASPGDAAMQTALGIADVVVLAVKPQQAEAVLADLAPHWSGQAVLVSVMAGVRLAQLQAAMPAESRVVRVMPNTPMAIGQGMSAVAAGDYATSLDEDLVVAICATGGEVLRLPETQFDAFTALAGSGPAFLFRYCEAMVQAALGQGFTPEQAALIVGQTVEGSVRFLRSRPDFPAAELRAAVTSPGGTTAAGLAMMDQADLMQAIAQTIAAATQRGKELGG